MLQMGRNENRIGFGRSQFHPYSTIAVVSDDDLYQVILDTIIISRLHLRYAVVTIVESRFNFTLAKYYSSLNCFLHAEQNVCCYLASEAGLIIELQNA